MRVREKLLDKTELSFEHILVHFVLELKKSKSNLFITIKAKHNNSNSKSTPPKQQENRLKRIGGLPLNTL